MRARSLKPGIFTNELLAVADPLYTLIFEGLWCLADREGRLEDRPAKIHIAINPGRSFEGTTKALEWLADNGFILRYQVGLVKLVQVIAFSKHQKPHQNEKPTELPPPPSTNGASPLLYIESQAPPRSEAGVDQGTKHLALTPSSLNPSSLNPDSCNPYLRTGSQVNGDLDNELEIHQLIGQIKGIYPRAGRQDWITGEKLIRNLVRDGTAWGEIIAGVERYAKHCRVTKRMAQNPGMFFGAIDRPWLQEWPLPEEATIRRAPTTEELEAREAKC